MKKLFLIMMVSMGLSAAPAYNGEINFEQNDKSSFKGHLKGDEYFSWVEDKDGEVVVYNKSSKNYEYAKVVEVQGELDLAPTGVKVGSQVKKAKMPKSSSVSYAPALYSIKENKSVSNKISKKTLSDIWKRKRSEKIKN